MHPHIIAAIDYENKIPDLWYMLIVQVISITDAARVSL